MRAVALSLLVLGACYQEGSVVPCTLTCESSACPAGLTCMSDHICQTPGSQMCSAILPDGGLALGIQVTAPNADLGDQFGASVSLSGDGIWLVVGAPNEASSASGIDGNQADNSSPASGAVYIFKWDGSTYVFSTYLKSPAPDAGDVFGKSVSISTDGKVLAVGAPGEDGNGTDLTGNPADDSSTSSGAVFLYERASTAAAWIQTRYIKAPVATVSANYGDSVAISDDGSFVAIGEPDNNSAYRVRFTPTYAGYGGTPAGASTGDAYGFSVAISGDGQTLFAGGPSEDGSSTGFDQPVDDNASNAGAVFIETQNNARTFYCKASNTNVGDVFGTSVASSRNGDLFAVGASKEDSVAIGVDGDQTNNAVGNSGAVYLFERDGLASASWTQAHYLKAPNTDNGDQFGSSLAVTAEGEMLVVGAPHEQSASTTDMSDNRATEAGAVYTFAKTGTTWQLSAYLKALTPQASDQLGASVAVSTDGTVVAAGAPQQMTGGGPGKTGTVYVFR